LRSTLSQKLNVFSSVDVVKSVARMSLECWTSFWHLVDCRIRLCWQSVCTGPKSNRLGCNDVLTLVQRGNLMKHLHLVGTKLVTVVESMETNEFCFIQTTCHSTTLLVNQFPTICAQNLVIMYTTRLCTILFYHGCSAAAARFFCLSTIHCQMFNFWFFILQSSHAHSSYCVRSRPNICIK